MTEEIKITETEKEKITALANELTKDKQEQSIKQELVERLQTFVAEVKLGLVQN